eukprot:gnl/MRDRNA2_/MRDRNA2_105002_c0_seq1.p1 gnl/MRDRNA2_/MRDRNA2_105002_c0~~gnl/MRDRNA2_/MRDRNA2_105002_c0_seq1.p1  ORF type:complete len:757 (+),score=164.38 gnl/MRDRNA2_/MRDRNA2_105002_c0_seq1:273-2273(+)
MKAQPEAAVAARAVASAAASGFEELHRTVDCNKDTVGSLETEVARMAHSLTRSRRASTPSQSWQERSTLSASTERRPLTAVNVPTPANSATPQNLDTTSRAVSSSEIVEKKHGFAQGYKWPTAAPRKVNLLPLDPVSLAAPIESQKIIHTPLPAADSNVKGKDTASRQVAREKKKAAKAVDDLDARSPTAECDARGKDVASRQVASEKQKAPRVKRKSKIPSARTQQETDVVHSTSAPLHEVAQPAMSEPIGEGSDDDLFLADLESDLVEPEKGTPTALATDSGIGNDAKETHTVAETHPQEKDSDDDSFLADLESDVVGSHEGTTNAAVNNSGVVGKGIKGINVEPHEAESVPQQNDSDDEPFLADLESDLVGSSDGRANTASQELEAVTDVSSARINETRAVAECASQEQDSEHDPFLADLESDLVAPEKETVKPVKRSSRRAEVKMPCSVAEPQLAGGASSNSVVPNTKPVPRQSGLSKPKIQDESYESYEEKRWRWYLENGLCSGGAVHRAEASQQSQTKPETKARLSQGLAASNQSSKRKAASEPADADQQVPCKKKKADRHEATRGKKSEWYQKKYNSAPPQEGSAAAPPRPWIQKPATHFKARPSLWAKECPGIFSDLPGSQVSGKDETTQKVGTVPASHSGLKHIREDKIVNTFLELS